MIFWLNSNLIEIIYECYDYGTHSFIHKDEYNLKVHERSHKARLGTIYKYFFLLKRSI